MNKKFTSLMAGLALVTAVSANAQGEAKALLSVPKSGAVKVETNALTKYVHLTDGQGNALAVEKGKVVTVQLSALTSENVNEALWEVTAGAKDPATGIKTYIFTNKATGAVLNFDRKANKEKPVLVAGTTNWFWGDNGLTNATKNVSISFSANGVSVKEANKGTKVEAFKSATYYLTAAGLNDFYGNGFALSFDKDIEENPFTATSLKAEGDDFTSKPADEDLYVRLNIPGTKKYVSVDTTLYTRQGIHEILGTDGIGYKLTTDTLVYNDNNDPTKHVFSTKPAYMYDFRFTLDPAAADGAGKLTIELKTPLKLDKNKKGSKFVSNEVYNDGVLESATRVNAYNKANYLSWTLFENGSKYLSTSNEAAKVLPIITFKAGNYADIENGAYYMIDARKTLRKTNDVDDEVKWIPNPDYGKYKVALVENCHDGVAKEGISKKAYSYLASTQWAVNKTAKGAYSVVNREFADVNHDYKLYDLGNNTYAVGGEQDTIKLVAVKDADKFVGYKNFTEKEAHEMVFGLQVASNIADAFVGAADKDGVLKLVKAGELNDDTQKFTLEKVGQTFELVEGSEVDSLVYNLYALKEVAGNRYLTLGTDNNFVFAHIDAMHAFAFKNTPNEGEYQMFVYNKTDKKVYVDFATGLVLEDVTDLEEDKDYKVIYSYESSALKAAGSVTEGKFTYTDKCNNQFADRFMIANEPKAEYATLKAGHKNISTLEDDSKFLTMFSDGLAVLKTADQAMGDTTVTAENLGLYLEEANMKDVVKPLYYITTARGIAEEDQKAGLRYYMVSLKDSVKPEDYVSFDRKVGFVLGAAQGDSALAIVSTKDSLAIKTSPAAVAFELTDVEGYYRIVLPGLTETIRKYEFVDGDWVPAVDKWGDPVYEVNPSYQNYLAVQNNVLYLTNKTNAYLFAVNATDVFPTANESLEAEGVKVLGANGSVVVLGAAGKNVTVSTVLGKTVASQVIASDNATIAAPAGVVFVTVDGETTKVVVK